MEALRERLVFIHRLLSDDGSLYVHLDGRMVFHTRLLLDEIFGEENFRNFITRKKCNPKNYTRKTYGNVADYILFYSKSDNYVWNRPVQPWDEERANREYQCVDETGRRYKKVPIHAPGIRHGETGREWKGRFPPPGKHWQFTPTTLDEMDNRGEIYWSPNGNPRRKIYLDGSDGIPLQNIWMDVKDAHNQNIHITGYPTEKNPEVLMRIIEASSNPGDLVLDCYSGSGTTLAVASKLHRYWIGVDSSNEAIKTTLFRFEFGTERMGDFVTPLRQKTLPLQSMVADFSLYEQVDRSETDRPETGRVESSSSK
jgi:adenine-specific DNA-methyltransferase